ncbi:hypothetical protein E2651_26830 [Streptomyces sp. MZ04]|nr:hypothetical protein E2651_26830 [Streptomyces sp. MZ04]
MGTRRPGRGHAIADRLGLPGLVESADSAYVTGMGVVLWVSGVAALVTALLVAALLRTPEPGAAADMAPRPADARQ